ncbi:MAG: sigma-54 dependent transcriptional regulator [Gammaproteobacteria bacterium]|jgi:two-component system, NtrC family, response regulator PilR
MEVSCRALIVDDEQDILDLLQRVLSRMGIDACAATSLAEAYARLESHAPDIHFCVTDMRLPDGNGIDLVEKISTSFPRMPVAVITAYGSIETAVESLRAGAFDFITKPIELGMLRKLVSNALKQAGMGQAQQEKPGFPRLIGVSPAMQELRNNIARVARSQAPVLIHGESGTGKELVAREIHRLGPRADQPFIAVNCGAIPTELMESEFFGHKKGSFTGAISDKQGLFEAADGGTLFLDEIAELPFSMQVKLLRAIQERAVRAIGSHEEVSVDIRILSATHKRLQDEVDNDRFRLDLYYRLNVISLDIPSLSDRPDDIEPLTRFLLHRIAISSGREQLELDPAAVRKLRHYSFPGNVRELENILERACAFCENSIITASDIRCDSAEPPQENSLVDAGRTLTDRMVTEPLTRSVARQEKEVLFRVLQETRWNRSETARKLGLTLRQVRYRIKKFHLE